jgi:hypothetical protein
MRESSARSKATLAERLRSARVRALAGRDVELDEFRQLLDERSDGRRVLWLHGVGGVGKTSLLDAFAAEVENCGWIPVRLDARELRESLAPLQALIASPAPRRVLFFDTCEDLGALEQDLFERHLPQLPDDVRLVFAGRLPPAGRWRHDPGWRAALRVRMLDVLDPEAASRVLTQGGIPPAQQPRWLAFTRGHPLALALAIESYRQRAASADEDIGPDAGYVTHLLERFIDTLPTPAHRAALELCAVARVTSESLLRAVLEDQASKLFAWLRRLSFMRAARDGLIPHDLVREVVVEELRWRDAETFRLRRRQVTRHLVERMQGARDPQVFMDFLYARRYAPWNEGIWTPEIESPLYADSLGESDRVAVADLVGEFEGAASRARALEWMDASPQAFTVFRGPDGIAGFIALLQLRGADWRQPRVESDPVLEQVRRYARDHATHRGAPADSSVMRWWIQRGGLHRPGSAQNLVQARCLLEWGAQTGIRRTFVPNTNAEFWRRHFRGIHFHAAEEYACELNGLRFVPYVRDWQQHPYWAWVSGAFDEQTDPAPSSSAPATLDAHALADAVRRALRDFASDARLWQSPLRGLLAGGDTESLRERLRAEVALLAREPRGEPLRRILEVTFLSGCPSQELAAERLDLPFGTYRHRLRAAETLLIERLRLSLAR